MSVIGVNLTNDQLVLHRGRDFKWTFENLDASNNPTAYPPGQLFFELGTHGEHNGRGHIDIEGANGGTYQLHQGAANSSAIPFDASQSVIKQEIESFPGVGKGNVSVVGRYTPQWIFTVSWTAALSLSAGVVELFNQTVHAAFSALTWVTGNFSVWLDGHYETNSFVFTLTHKGSLLEQELINFVVGVVADIVAAINNALNAVAEFTGKIASISLIYAPLRHFDYEFINDKALTPMGAITATSSLTGSTPTLSAVQDAPGRAALTIWPFTISGSTASIKVESDSVDLIVDRTKWNLVFLPSGEPKGGDPVAQGVVRVQGVI